MRERDDWHLTEDVAHAMGRGDPFAAAIRGTRMPMIITDPRRPDNPIVFANEAFQDLTGYARAELLGRNCRLLQGPETDRASVARIREAVEAESALTVELLNYRRDGSTFWNALYVSPVRADDGEVQFFFASQLDITERIEAERAVIAQKALVEEEVRRRTADLEAALEAKTTLLHEVDHRVKNNLMMIGSLLRLQSRSLGDPALAATLDAMLNRVDALAAVHRRLYQSDDISRFDLGAFAASLVDDVLGASGREDIRVETTIAPVLVKADQAAPLGLMLNEVVTNAIKHGFDGRGGTLRVHVGEADGRAVIWIADDGPGLDPAAPAKGSIGRTLVGRLSRQVGATTTWSPADPGTRVVITLPAQDAVPAPGGRHDA